MGEGVDNFAFAAVHEASAPVDQSTDECLVAAARAGDNSAFEEIFTRHRFRIARITGRFFNRPEKVEELVQETFAKAYFKLSDYSKQAGSSFLSWLIRIAINCCHDELRRARRRPESPFSSITENESLFLNTRSVDRRDAESVIISRDLADKLLSRLKADDRLVLTLLEAEGLSIAEIAKTLGWGISKVKVRAHRARAALRRAIQDLA